MVKHLIFRLSINLPHVKIDYRRYHVGQHLPVDVLRVPLPKGEHAGALLERLGYGLYEASA